MYAQNVKCIEVSGTAYETMYEFTIRREVLGENPSTTNPTHDQRFTGAAHFALPSTTSK